MHMAQASGRRMERLGEMKARPSAPAFDNSAPGPALQSGPGAINWSEKRVDPSDGQAYPRSR
jgi:hypothetical protein